MTLLCTNAARETCSKQYCTFSSFAQKLFLRQYYLECTNFADFWPSKLFLLQCCKSNTRIVASYDIIHWSCLNHKSTKNLPFWTQMINRLEAKTIFIWIDSRHLELCEHKPLSCAAFQRRFLNRIFRQSLYVRQMCHGSSKAKTLVTCKVYDSFLVHSLWLIRRYKSSA